MYLKSSRQKKRNGKFIKVYHRINRELKERTADSSNFDLKDEWEAEKFYNKNYIDSFSCLQKESLELNQFLSKKHLNFFIPSFFQDKSGCPKTCDSPSIKEIQTCVDGKIYI